MPSVDHAPDFDLSILAETASDGRRPRPTRLLLDGPGRTDNVRTIAWLVSHLTDVFLERWEWTFGGHSLRSDALCCMSIGS